MRSVFRGILSIIQYIRTGAAFWITVALSIVLSYFCYERVQQLPHPDTWIELTKFYFNNTAGYLTTMLFTFFVSIIVLMVGISIILNGIAFREEYELWVVIMTIIVGIIFVVASFYFFSVCVWLLFVVLSIGVLALVALHLFNNSK
jgi:hypothetical protein